MNLARIEEIGYDPERDIENPTGSVFCSHGAGFNVSWDKVPEYMHLENQLEKERALEEAKRQSEQAARQMPRAARTLFQSGRKRAGRDIYPDIWKSRKKRRTDTENL